jgi:hypothetical protein
MAWHGSRQRCGGEASHRPVGSRNVYPYPILRHPTPPGATPSLPLSRGEAWRGDCAIAPRKADPDRTHMLSRRRRPRCALFAPTLAPSGVKACRQRLGAILCSSFFPVKIHLPAKCDFARFACSMPIAVLYSRAPAHPGGSTDAGRPKALGDGVELLHRYVRLPPVFRHPAPQRFSRRDRFKMPPSSGPGAPAEI